MAKSSLDVFLRLHGQRKFSKELTAAGSELEAMGLKGAAAMSRFAASGEKLKAFGRNWTRHVSLPVAVGAGLAVKAAIDWESAFTGVRKTVNATEAQYASMERGIRQMSLHIPVAANDLAGIAEAAGQLGIERKAILGFTRTIADLGVSTNLAGEEGATTLARFANITQMPQSQFRRLGSTIVALGNAGASTESDIAAMGLRIAAAGNFVGMSEPQILGIANALSSVGIEAEAGGTSASQAIKVINSAVAGGGEKLERFAGIAGVGAHQFAAAWIKHPATALTSWIEGLARLKDQGKDVPALLNSLDPKLRGTRVQDTLLRAAGAGDLFRESLSLGSKAWEENTALSEEAGKRYKTVASRLQILKNKVTNAGVTLGQKLLPPLIDFVNVAGPAVGAIATGFSALPSSIQAATLGLLVLTGPVASGLGYFASGIGKLLVLTNGLAKFGQVFSASMAEAGYVSKLTLSSSFAEAWAGTGAAAALQTAKGFAYSLAPAIAAYGIGNVVTSATNKDWQDAGFEAGGMIAGGIAGFILGGGSPFGAMIGAGVGSYVGELASKALGGGSRQSPLVEKLAKGSKEATYWFGEQQKASKALAGAETGLENAHRRQHEAIGKVGHAQQHLTELIQQYGPDTRPVLKAEGSLAQKRWSVARATQAIKDKEKLRGVALSGYKASTRWAIGTEKEQIHLLRLRAERLGHLLHYEQFHGGSREKLGRIGKRIGNVMSSLHEEEAKLGKSVSDAAKKVSGKWATHMAKMSAVMLKFETRPFETKLDHLGKNPGPKKLAEGFKEMSKQTSGLLRNFSKLVEKSNQKAEELEGRRLPDFSLPGFNLHPDPLGPPAPHHGRHRRGSRRANPSAAQSLMRPLRRPGRVKEGSLSHVVEIHLVNENTLNLDGKPVAEKTTKESRKAANLQ